jgi:hypothetical protein
MMVKELLERIVVAYPGASPEAMRAFKPVFQARLGGREGPALAKAATEVLAGFRPKYGQPFPIPADFEAALPDLPRRLPAGRAIDMRQHAERVGRLIDEWRRSVTARPEVRQAMEHIARGLAHEAAWRGDTKPIALTAQQTRLAEQRALSLQRRVEHGPPEHFRFEAWWAQIAAIAERWNVATSPEEWGR